MSFNYKRQHHVYPDVNKSKSDKKQYRYIKRHSTDIDMVLELAASSGERLYQATATPETSETTPAPEQRLKTHTDIDMIVDMTFDAHVNLPLEDIRVITTDQHDPKDIDMFLKLSDDASIDHTKEGPLDSGPKRRRDTAAGSRSDSLDSLGKKTYLMRPPTDIDRILSMGSDPGFALTRSVSSHCCWQRVASNLVSFAEYDEHDRDIEYVLQLPMRCLSSVHGVNRAG